MTCTEPQVWAVIYTPASFDDNLYQAAVGILDNDSQTRVKRFYRREDACRTLIGKLLVRAMLQRNGVDIVNVIFSSTKEGKPYVTLPEMNPAFVYNITHDNALIGLVFASGDGSKLPKIGVDVMKVRVPRNETLGSFVESMSDQLTTTEKDLLVNVPGEESLQQFFWMWTLKEAYTKALGLGLGFDFQRVEFLVDRDLVLVDGQAVRGWRFDLFVIQDGDERYQMVVAGEYDSGRTQVVRHTKNPNWLTVYAAVDFTKDTIRYLVPAITLDQ